MSKAGTNANTSKGGLKLREFFMKDEVFAAYKEALLEDKVSPSWSENEGLSGEGAGQGR